MSSFRRRNQNDLPTTSHSRRGSPAAHGAGCPAPRGQDLLKKAAKLGFTRAIIPRTDQPKQKIDGLDIIAVKRVADAIARFRR